jgi:methylmalonyl-CoA mutase N-terminal domain/subunit
MHLLVNQLLIVLTLAEVIVGVNKYRLKEAQTVDVLSIDNKAVRESQVRLYSVTH